MLTTGMTSASAPMKQSIRIKTSRINMIEDSGRDLFYVQGRTDGLLAAVDSVNRMLDGIVLGKTDSVYGSVEFNQLYERLKSLIKPSEV
jgi:hypothetical protein